ncbi:nicotinate-nucleotide--dimethylbenzimidazole phosphoribosyltransferase [Streptomyces sp. NPDC057197]|uniref:nicotinate-nucleotide--dimethylbenzimidazole phosphoribosyltransferase n=1 Tax=Streptomyces sp. NPDC057197 TaxID=3346045 RepID=UPI00362AD84F
MTDTGQVPGEGLPESAGMVEQPGVPAHGAYTYLSESPAEDEDLLLPGSQGAWGNEVPPPAPEPVVEAVHQPGPHETSGRDSGSVDLSGVLHPDPQPAAPAPAPRRPLHLGPPTPDASTSPVRSLADRGPADAPVRQPGPAPTVPGPEYLDAAQAAPAPVVSLHGAPQGAAPWGAPAAPAAPQTPAEPAAGDAVAPDAEPVGPAQAAVARLTAQAGAPAPAPDAATEAGHAPETRQPEQHGHDDRHEAAPELASEAAAVAPGPAAEPAPEGESGPVPSADQVAPVPVPGVGSAGTTEDTAAEGVPAQEAVAVPAGTDPVTPDAQVRAAGQAPEPAGTEEAAQPQQPAEAQPAAPAAPVADSAPAPGTATGVPEAAEQPVADETAVPEQAAAAAPGQHVDAPAPVPVAAAEPVTAPEQAPAPDQPAPAEAAPEPEQAVEPAPAPAQAPAAPVEAETEAVPPQVPHPGAPEASAEQTAEQEQPVTAPAPQPAGTATQNPEAGTATQNPERQIPEAAEAPEGTQVPEAVDGPPQPVPAPEETTQPQVPADASAVAPAAGPDQAQAAPVADAPAPEAVTEPVTPEAPAVAEAQAVPQAPEASQAPEPTQAPDPDAAPTAAAQAPDVTVPPTGEPGTVSATPHAEQPPAAAPEQEAPAAAQPAPVTDPSPVTDPVPVPQPVAEAPQEPVVAVPAPRSGDTEPVATAATAAPAEPDPDVVQQADDLETRGAGQEEHEEHEHRAAETAEDPEAPEGQPEDGADLAPEAEAPRHVGPAAPGYDDAEREAVLKVMRERRDIRNGFRDDPIPHEVLLRVLEAAHTAPSVGHSQPWDFVVIRSADTRRAMHELAERQREAYAKSLPKGRAKQFKELKIEAILDTPVNIVVTADPTRGGRHTLGRHTQPQMAPYSAALAVENLWLAARAEGLGVGWVSFFDEREMVRTLGLPEHLEVIAYLCVGYVDEFPDEPELMQAGWSKRRPLSWVVHEETYGRRALPGEDPHDLLAETVAQIRPLDAKALGEAWERQKRMTKPAGALGMLEIISAQLSGLSRQCPPPIPEPAAVAVFAGDHGVHAQGVTPWPQEVTAQMVANFLGGGAVCNAFANQVGAEVCVVDVGVAADLPATPGLLPRKVRAGTSDMTTGPAMTREEAKKAIEVGIETARDLVAAGNKALLTGEMGIANTTASAALISVYTGVDPAEVTGRGTGINDETLAHKTEVVRRALDVHRPDPADPIGVLAAIGGFEHAAIVGLLLGGASLRTPVILDGVSAGAAALVARAIAPEVLAACIAGHRSAEPGHVAALNKLGLRPLVDLDLRLGEGTGALLALPLVQSTARAMHEVATFDSAGVTEK